MRTNETKEKCLFSLKTKHEHKFNVTHLESEIK